MLSLIGFLASNALTPVPYSLPQSSGVMPARPVLRTSHVDLKCKQPLPCAFTPVNASTGGRPVQGAPIATNPMNKKQLITAGNDYNCSRILSGYYVTSDGGKSWIRSCGTVPSGRGNGNPVVAFDLNNTVYRGGSATLSDGTSAVVIDHSTDGGATWSTPVNSVLTLYSGGGSDTAWLEVDTNPVSPRKNSLYVSATQFDPYSNSDISVSHSTDGGLTWTTVPIGQFVVFPNVNQFSDLATGPDGTVYVSWLRCKGNLSVHGCGGLQAQLLMAKSTDGGSTWSGATTIATVTLAPNTCGTSFYGCIPNTKEPLTNIPAIAVDSSSRSSSGVLYAVAYNYTGSFCQVIVTKSKNGGRTWSMPVAVVPPTDTHDQFFPWLTVSPKKGLVGVSWMDRRNDPSNHDYEEFAGISSDGGKSFVNIQLTTSPSNPDNDGFGGTSIGGLTGNAWDTKESLYAAWTDTTVGHAQVFVGGTKF
jgi:hypothetical protein